MMAATTVNRFIASQRRQARSSSASAGDFVNPARIPGAGLEGQAAPWQRRVRIVGVVDYQVERVPGHRQVGPRIDAG